MIFAALSTEAWIGIGSIVVTVVLALIGAPLLAVMGYLIREKLNTSESRTNELMAIVKPIPQQLASINTTIEIHGREIDRLRERRNLDRNEQHSKALGDALRVD